MSKLIPAIIASSYHDVSEKVQLASRFVSMVHLDVMDGSCTGHASWPYNSKNDTTFNEILSERVGLPMWENMNYEVHLMIRNPKEALEQWFKAGAERAILHADFNIQPDICEKYVGNMQFTVAILPQTPIETLEAWMPYVDRILIMGNNHIGDHGMPLDESVFEKAKTIQEKYPGKSLSIDIGVQEHTWEKLVEHGFEYLVAASWFWGSDDKGRLVDEVQNS